MGATRCSSRSSRSESGPGDVLRLFHAPRDRDIRSAVPLRKRSRGRPNRKRGARDDELARIAKPPRIRTRILDAPGGAESGGRGAIAMRPDVRNRHAPSTATSIDQARGGGGSPAAHTVRSHRLAWGIKPSHAEAGVRLRPPGGFPRDAIPFDPLGERVMGKTCTFRTWSSGHACVIYAFQARRVFKRRIFETESILTRRPCIEWRPGAPPRSPRTNQVTGSHGMTRSRAVRNSRREGPEMSSFTTRSDRSLRPRLRRGGAGVCLHAEGRNVGQGC